jgi:hypothetical protein
MTDRELLQQALDALEKHVYEYETIQALHTRLASESEPVAWITTWNEPQFAGVELHWEKKYKGPSCKYTPLYKAPPKKEWVGLTDEEVDNCAMDAYTTEMANAMVTGVVNVRGVNIGIAKAIEAKLKEKNSE